MLAAMLSLLPLRPLLAGLAALLAPAATRAAGDPVSFELRNDLAPGARPSLQLTAAVRVREIQLVVTRDDGVRFEARHPGLLPRQKATLAVGDARPGRAHYQGQLSLQIVGGNRWSYDLAFDAVVRGEVSLRYDVEHLDLPGKVLRFQLSRPAARAELTVVGEDGSPIGHGEASYEAAAPGTWLAVPWTEERPGRLLMLKLRATAVDGLVAAAELTPWSVEVEHEEVTFDTDSAVVRPSEAGKLEASLARIQEIAARAGRFIPVKLYIAGHTDTVGARDHNRELSLARARAIAAYLRGHGLALPIAYQGFGEEVLRVATPDDTDEPRNRRVDYVLGAGTMAPPFSAAYRTAAGDWKNLR